jgi:hypothetical protein
MKNKKLIIGGVVLVIILGIGIGLLIWSYLPELKPYAINTPEAAAHILIAAQVSKHKAETLKAISDYYTGKDVFISVIDVNGLPGINPDEWDYIVLFSEIRWYTFNSKVKAFLNRASTGERILLYNTSGGTQMAYENVDAITSASVNPEQSAQAIIQAIDTAIGQNP